MADRPVIFSGSMVRALLAGTKTQTRRLLPEHKQVLAHEPAWNAVKGEDGVWRFLAESENLSGSITCDERYAPGDRLYVREAHYLTDDGDEQFAVYACDDDDVREHLARIDGLPAYISDKIKAAHRKLRPSIHMPRWASRLTLTVTEVRVERLQDISEEDALAEGWPYADADPTRIPSGAKTPTGWFQMLWSELHGAAAWAANPWVAALTFNVTPANIDNLPEQAGGRA